MSSTPARLMAEPSPHWLSVTVSTEIKEFAIVPLHAAPSDAVAEIDSLYDVYLDVWQKWDLEVRQPPPHPQHWALGPPFCPGLTSVCLLVEHHVDG